MRITRSASRKNETNTRRQDEEMAQQPTGKKEKRGKKDDTVEDEDNDLASEKAITRNTRRISRKKKELEEEEEGLTSEQRKKMKIDVKLKTRDTKRKKKSGDANEDLGEVNATLENPPGKTYKKNPSMKRKLEEESSEEECDGENMNEDHGQRIAKEEEDLNHFIRKAQREGTSNKEINQVTGTNPQKNPRNLEVRNETEMGDVEFNMRKINIQDNIEGTSTTKSKRNDNTKNMTFEELEEMSYNESQSAKEESIVTARRKTKTPDDKFKPQNFRRPRLWNKNSENWVKPQQEPFIVSVLDKNETITHAEQNEDENEESEEKEDDNLKEFKKQNINIEENIKDTSNAKGNRNYNPENMSFEELEEMSYKESQRAKEESIVTARRKTKKSDDKFNFRRPRLWNKNSENWVKPQEPSIVSVLDKNETITHAEQSEDDDKENEGSEKKENYDFNEFKTQNINFEEEIKDTPNAKGKRNDNPENMTFEELEEMSYKESQSAKEESIVTARRKTETPDDKFKPQNFRRPRLWNKNSENWIKFVVSVLDKNETTTHAVQKEDNGKEIEGSEEKEDDDLKEIKTQYFRRPRPRKKKSENRVDPQQEPSTVSVLDKNETIANAAQKEDDDKEIDASEENKDDNSISQDSEEQGSGSESMYDSDEEYFPFEEDNPAPVSPAQPPKGFHPPWYQRKMRLQHFFSVAEEHYVKLLKRTGLMKDSTVIRDKAHLLSIGTKPK